MTALASRQLTILVATAIVASLVSARAHADFVVHAVEQVGLATVRTVERTTDDGTHLLDFNLATPGLGEESISVHALGPDGYVYIADNTLGNMLIERFDPATGQSVDYPWGSFTGTHKIPEYTVGTRIDFAPNGDVFAPGISNFSSAPIVYRVDAQSGERRSSAVDAPSLIFVDSAVRPAPPAATPYDSEVLALNISGDAFRFLSRSADDDSIPIGDPPANDFMETIDFGFEGVTSMTFGPDGLLYLRVAHTAGASVVRYDLDARMIVDTFIAPVANDYDFPFAGADVTFGPEGDLFLVIAGLDDYPANPVYSSHVLRFDGQTGSPKGPALVGVADGAAVVEILYLPVPEPSAALVSVSAILAIGKMGRRARGSRQRWS